MSSTRRTAAVAASVLLAAALLSACAGTGHAAPASSDPVTASPTSTQSPEVTPTPTPTAAAAIALPTDCRALLSAAVLAQLADTPLNDPAFGPSGVQPDGSLVCIWGDPGADTTGLTTTIARMNRGPALDMLNVLATTEGFSCYLPDEGTRCEKTWQNDTYPVTDGRTLYWRQDVLIDTRYSNLAPTGYTASIVATLFG
jgi:hypothetical protein